MGDRNNKSKQLVKPINKSAKLNTHIKGTIGEYQEIVNLTKAGWYISKSCDPQCPFDLVAVHPNGDIKFIDVKSESYRIKDKSKINRILTKNQKNFKKTSGLNINLEMMG